MKKNMFKLNDGYVHLKKIQNTLMKILITLSNNILIKYIITFKHKS